MLIGINGKFLNAVQSLYNNLSCTVRVTIMKRTGSE